MTAFVEWATDVCLAAIIGATLIVTVAVIKLVMDEENEK